MSDDCDGRVSISFEVFDAETKRYGDEVGGDGGDIAARAAGRNGGDVAKRAAGRNGGDVAARAGGTHDADDGDDDGEAADDVADADADESLDALVHAASKLVELDDADDDDEHDDDDDGEHDADDDDEHDADDDDEHDADDGDPDELHGDAATIGDLPEVSRKVAPRVRTRRVRPRSKTIAMKRLTRAELARGAEMYPPVDGVARPQTRAECRDGVRPCPWVACKHHLYLDINPRTGSIKINFPDVEPWELEQTCALDIADQGGLTLEEIGLVTNLTRERVRQVEVRGLLTLRARGGSLR